MLKYKDWREIGPAALSFSYRVLSTWKANSHSIPREIKDAMRAAMRALCELDDLIEAHVQKEDADDESDLPVLDCKKMNNGRRYEQH